MAPHMILAAQLVPQYKPIGRCNNYAVLKSIPCSPECKIVELMLLDHCLSYALTAATDVPIVYLQQFWRTVSKKFPNNPKRIKEDYHSIKDDVPFVSMYTTRNVSVRGMLFLDAFLTTKIRETNDLKVYETVFMKVAVPMNQPQPVVSIQGANINTPRAHRSPTVSATPLEMKKRKQTAGESSSPRRIIKKKRLPTPSIPPPGDDRERDEIADATLLSLALHKTALIVEAQENIAKVQEKLDEEEIDRMVEGSVDDESYASVFADTILNDESADVDDTKNKIEPRCQKENPEHEVLKLCDTIVLELTVAKTNEMIKKEMPRLVKLAVDKDREVSPVDISGMVSNEFEAHGPKLIEELFRKHMQNITLNLYPKPSLSTATTSIADLQQQLYLTMKAKSQDQAVDPDI
nr:hypothetical protein [Tanacetum cinerariifolium]